MKTVFSFLLPALLLLTGYVHCQRLDTVRTYICQAGVLDFKIKIKSDQSFIYINDELDTIKGRLLAKDNKYFLMPDTNYVGKRRIKFCYELSKSFFLARNKSNHDLLLRLSFDTTRFFHIDTNGVAPGLTGIYITSNGFCGCSIDVDENDSVSFEPFCDMGGRESKETYFWATNGDLMHLEGNGYVSSWFTGNNDFYILPYLIIGKQIRRKGKIFYETYNYFVKNVGEK